MISKKNVEDILSLTPMQEGMLFHYLKNPSGKQYFEQVYFHISGQIDVGLFEEALNFVVANH